jgi:hypothetical protein
MPLEKMMLIGCSSARACDSVLSKAEEAVLQTYVLEIRIVWPHRKCNMLFAGLSSPLDRS